MAAALLTVVVAGRAVAQRTEPAARPDDRNADRATTDRGAADRGTADRGTAERGGPGGHASHADKMVANQLLEMSKGEVDLANFALKHTQNEEVKRFAQQMIEEHSNFNNQLAKFASPELARDLGGQSPTGTEPGTTAPQKGSRPDATTPPGRTGAPARPGEPGTGTAADRTAADRTGADRAGADRGSETAAGGDPSVQICEDIGKQIGSSVQRELSQYQGSDFDRAYVGQQFWGHVIFVSAAKGAEKHVSQDLQQVLNQGATTGEKHLEHCRKLIRDLSANVARGTSGTQSK